MLDDELPPVDPAIDYAQILPIQQKRTIAFINHFVMSTVSYLNRFAQSCESRFMDFEHKLQKVEASLLILETQLSSIHGLESCNTNFENTSCNNKSESVIAEDTIVNLSDFENEETNYKIKISEDPRYQKYFKMLQFGVPEAGVKLKMRNEGIDPNILSDPDRLVDSEKIN